MSSTDSAHGRVAHRRTDFPANFPEMVLKICFVHSSMLTGHQPPPPQIDWHPIAHLSVSRAELHIFAFRVDSRHCKGGRAFYTHGDGDPVWIQIELLKGNERCVHTCRTMMHSDGEISVKLVAYFWCSRGRRSLSQQRSGRLMTYLGNDAAFFKMIRINLIRWKRVEFCSTRRMIILFQ